MFVFLCELRFQLPKAKLTLVGFGYAFRPLLIIKSEIIACIYFFGLLTKGKNARLTFAILGITALNLYYQNLKHE